MLLEDQLMSLARENKRLCQALKQILILTNTPGPHTIEQIGDLAFLALDETENLADT